jgi:hypothetical protein
MVWYHPDMIDVPMAELLDDSTWLLWLERHLPPDGLACPHCQRSERRLCRQQGAVPAYRGRACDGSYPLRTTTVFEKTRPRPATLVLRRRGRAKGDPTARCARELGLSRKQLHPLRQRVQTHLHDTAPVDVLTGPTFEADDLYQHAGEKQHAPSRSR